MSDENKLAELESYFNAIEEAAFKQYLERETANRQESKSSLHSEQLNNSEVSNHGKDG